MIGFRWCMLRAFILLGCVFLGLGMFLAFLTLIASVDEPMITAIGYLIPLAFSIIMMLFGIGLILFVVAWNFTHRHVSETLDKGWQDFVGR